jgi:hypothetical protein
MGSLLPINRIALTVVRWRYKIPAMKVPALVIDVAGDL